MTMLAKLRAVRLILASGVAIRGAAYAMAVAAGVIVAAALVDMLVEIPLAVRGVIVTLASITALSTMVFFALRDRQVVSLERVALWIEEREPSLEFALVTALGSVSTDIQQPLGERWVGLAWRRAARAIAPAIATVVVAALFAAMLPSGALARIGAPRAGDALERAPIVDRRFGDRLSPLVAEVRPPSYSRVGVQTIDEPSSIRTLVGGTVALRGRGDAAGINATLPGGIVNAHGENERWSIVITVGPRPVGVRLSDGQRERIVTIEPIDDQPPAVVLREPRRDTVLRRATGRVALDADATDDYGLSSAGFEYIISSGEGETFTFRSGVVGAVRPSGSGVTLAATLVLDSLALKPGDVLHLRAVARDANAVTGPGIGTSETRALRIARAGEYDSLAVEAAAPTDVDKSVISERMLIMLAESLEKRRPTLARATVVDESRAIAADQTRLRKSVGEVIFSRLGGEPGGEESTAEDVPARARTMEELLRRADSATNATVEALDFAGGESPVVAVNRPLLDAYNAMWEASTELEVGEPARALPHMRRALAAIERARRAERVYLRGRPPQIVVDVNRARLEGKERGVPSVRAARIAIDSAQRSRELRFARIVDMARTGAPATVDSLLLLRIDVLAEAPTFARALNDAADALRRRDPSGAASALARARRALAGPVVVRDSLGRWGAGVLP